MSVLKPIKRYSVADLQILKDLALGERKCMVAVCAWGDSYKEKRTHKIKLNNIAKIITKIELEMEERLYKLL